jgi:hypothetical protein
LKGLRSLAAGLSSSYAVSLGIESLSIANNGADQKSFDVFLKWYVKYIYREREYFKNGM